MSGPLRIGFDATAAATNRPTGVGVALERTVAALRRRHDLRLEVLYRVSRVRRRRAFLPGSWRLFHDRVSVHLARRLDVFHGPDARLPRFRGPALVSTVHDLSARHGFSSDRFRRTREDHWEAVARRASLVVTYTRAVADEVHRELGIPAERIAVVPLAPNDALLPPPPEAARDLALRRTGGRPFVLCLGELSTRKNTVGALEAFAAADLRGHALVLCGPDGRGSEAVVPAAQRLGISDRVVRPSYLPGEEVASLLRAAEALLFPSRYEGFGMPVLEAFRAEVPVVASTAASVLEVAGGAALHADPDDHRALAHALREAVQPERRAELVALGAERLREFSWERVAQRLSAVYRAAHEGRPAPTYGEEAPCTS